MRVGTIVLASACIAASATASLAQNLDNIINQLPAIAQSGIAKLAEAEWKKLPASELDCIDQKLHERGDSVQSFSRRGIFPFDSRTAEIRSQCRASSASASIEQTSGQTKYGVDGLTVGSRMKLDGASYREYKCSPSEQFEGFTWCQRTRSDKERRGAFSANYSILHAQDGSVTYVNRIQEPAFLGQSETDKEIQQYSRKFGEPARITKSPRRAGGRDGTIALWGAATLEPLDPESIRILAEGRSPKKGLLIDFIGNFSRSAKEGLPIFRIAGGPGFVWAASVDQEGRGALRFAAVDASALYSNRLPAQGAEVALAAPEQMILPARQANIFPAPQHDMVDRPAQGDAAETSIAELKQTIEALKADLAKSTEKLAQLEQANGEAERQTPTGAARSGGQGAESPDPMPAQIEPEGAGLGPESQARKIVASGASTGLVALLIILASVQLAHRRKATRTRHEALKAELTPALIAPRSSGNSGPPALTNRAPVPDAQGRVSSPAEEFNPGKNVDRDDLVNQLAETLGIPEPEVSIANPCSDPVLSHDGATGEQEHCGAPEAENGRDQTEERAQAPAIAEPGLSDIAAGPSPPVVPESAPNADHKRTIEPSQETEPMVNGREVVPANS